MCNIINCCSHEIGVYLFVIVKEFLLCICLFLVFSCTASKLTKGKLQFAEKTIGVIESSFIIIVTNQNTNCNWDNWGIDISSYLRVKCENFHHVGYTLTDRQVFSLSPS